MALGRGRRLSSGLTIIHRLISSGEDSRTSPEDARHEKARVAAKISLASKPYPSRAGTANEIHESTIQHCESKIHCAYPRDPSTNRALSVRKVAAGRGTS